MREPSVRTSRLAIAGGFAAALLLAGGGFLLGRATLPHPAPPVPATPIASPPAPTPDDGRVLDRADIAAAARAAADARASGAGAPPGQADLPGRRFLLALPFGCAGPAGADSPAPLRWRYDDATQSLRIHVALIDWQPDEWGVPADPSAAPHGFWVTRPWSTADTCPVSPSDGAATGTESVILPGQTLALVAFGPQPLKPGNGYDAVVRIPRETLDTSRGLRARISGRLARVPGDGAIRCVQPAGIEQQPICAVAVTFDELVVDNPATGQTLATWTIGRAGEKAQAPAG